MDIILRPFAWLLLLFYNIVDNYGIALILFAILVKLILFPFSLKGKRGMIQMNLLSGKLQALQKQYGKDKERYNMEVQKLYAKENVNPMGGCLWTMLPLFILIPLYSVIRQPLKYMMNLSAEQIQTVARTLNWESKALEMGWITDTAASFESGAYNELYLASLMNESNLDAVKNALGGAEVFAMNFDFFGIDLSQVPQWNFWEGGITWTGVGLVLLVVISAVTGVIFSLISQKTNQVNRQGQEQNAQAQQTNKMMMWMTPLMSLWIGFIMPGLLCLYWIANNVLSMLQEVISGRMLKKDYEEAARLQAENEAREKEEEKQRRRMRAQQRAQDAEEAKKNKKNAKKDEASKQDRAAAELSRVGMRNYARGRAYDPDRFGGVTPYRDPSAPVDEQAIAAALAAREQSVEEPEEKETVTAVETTVEETAVETVAEEIAADGQKENGEE